MSRVDPFLLRLHPRTHLIRSMGLHCTFEPYLRVFWQIYPGAVRLEKL
jgi:hypothetical protein